MPTITQKSRVRRSHVNDSLNGERLQKWRAEGCTHQLHARFVVSQVDARRYRLVQGNDQKIAGGFMQYFSSMLDALRTARDPYGKGKPRENNTWLHLVGSFEKPERIDVQFHRTNIVRFYPDGSREIHHGWTTMTTLDRIREYAGVSIGMCALKAVNGYRPRTESAYFISTDGWHNGPWVPFQAKTGEYIRITPDNEFDMSTIGPIKTECITHPKELRRTMRHLSKCAAILRGYAKLADNEHCFENGTIDLQAWLLKHVHTPLPDTELDPKPYIFVGSSGSLKNNISSAFDAIRWTIARREGWTGPCEIMEKR
jgi:hypothetical protein